MKGVAKPSTHLRVGLIMAPLALLAWWWGASQRADQETYLPATLLAIASIALFSAAATRASDDALMTKRWAFVLLSVTSLVVSAFTFVPWFCLDSASGCFSIIGVTTSDIWLIWFSAVPAFLVVLTVSARRLHPV